MGLVYSSFKIKTGFESLFFKEVTQCYYLGALAVFAGFGINSNQITFFDK